MPGRKRLAQTTHTFLWTYSRESSGEVWQRLSTCFLCSSSQSHMSW